MEGDVPRRATRSMILEGGYGYGRCQRRKKEKGLDYGSKDQRKSLGTKCVFIYVTRGIDSLMGAIIRNS